MTTIQDEPRPGCWVYILFALFIFFAAVMTAMQRDPA